ncbi:enolase-phosphatase E1 [Elasticomyces elasticus]|nr:enolase-phosphatase E1 [Elasticomyces elasticus]
MLIKQDLEDIEVVLLDIEGTICPISFVKNTLFPYAIRALPQVLKQKWDDSAFTPYRDAFPEEYRSSPEALQAHVEDLTRRDVKVAYLKNLQGYLWQSGYESRAYNTPLFPDVLPQLRKWCEAGLACSIYSSGSVFAQRLLFEHIKDDSSSDPKAIVDERKLIRAWFDTTNAGPKTETASYSKIAGRVQVRPYKVLFLSDNVREVQAALDIGMKSIVVDRPDNALLTEEEQTEYDVVASLEEIKLPRG